MAEYVRINVPRKITAATCIIRKLQIPSLHWRTLHLRYKIKIVCLIDERAATGLRGPRLDQGPGLLAGSIVRLAVDACVRHMHVRSRTSALYVPPTPTHRIYRPSTFITYAC